MWKMFAIELDQVAVRQGGLEILAPISTGIERGSVTAIIGPNGAGKTTLLKAILGLISCTGSIRFYSREGKQLRRRPVIGYVPQRLDFDRGLPMTVRDLMSMGMQRLPVWCGITKQTDSLARRELKRVEAEGLMDRPLGKLSGGEFQRVQLALALQIEPDIVLLDEPVSGVDVAGEHLFCDLLQSVKDESRLTLVMVSHDLSVVSNHATHAVCLNHGLIAAGPVGSVLTPDVLSCMFGPHTMVAEVPGLSAHVHECSHEHHHHPHP